MNSDDTRLRYFNDREQEQELRSAESETNDVENELEKSIDEYLKGKLANKMDVCELLW